MCVCVCVCKSEGLGFLFLRFDREIRFFFFFFIIFSRVFGTLLHATFNAFLPFVFARNNNSRNYYIVETQGELAKDRERIESTSNYRLNEISKKLRIIERFVCFIFFESIAENSPLSLFSLIANRYNDITIDTNPSSNAQIEDSHARKHDRIEGKKDRIIRRRHPSAKIIRYGIREIGRSDSDRWQVSLPAKGIEKSDR